MCELEHEHHCAHDFSSRRHHAETLAAFHCYAGHAFYSVGLAPCNLNTAVAAVGSSFTVPFAVYDNGSPPLASTVNRTLLVVSPCSAGMLELLQSCKETVWAGAPALSRTCASILLLLRLCRQGLHCTVHYRPSNLRIDSKTPASHPQCLLHDMARGSIIDQGNAM